METIGPEAIWFLPHTSYVSTLPIRNGNTHCLIIGKVKRIKRKYLTYKEWKPCVSHKNRSPLKIDACKYLTYKEWKII